MPDRYWSRILAIGLGALLIGAVTLWLYSDEQRQQRAETAHHDRDKAYSEAYEACGSISGALDQLYCVLDEAETTKEEKRDEYDLKAQQDMALFAYSVAIFTFASLLVGGAGVYFVARSLNLTRELFYADKRPWLDARVLLDPMSIRREKSGYFLQFAIKAVNSGQIPATDVVCVYFFYEDPLEGEAEATFMRQYEDDLSGRVRRNNNIGSVHPNSTGHCPGGLILGGKNVDGAHGEGYIGGWITYRFTGSRAIHGTPFFWRYLFVNESDAGGEKYRFIVNMPEPLSVGPT